METTSITADELRERMAVRRVTHGELARASGLQQTTVSGILSGALHAGPVREAKLARGILRLGLHRAEPRPRPPAAPVVIRLPEE